MTTTYSTPAGVPVDLVRTVAPVDTPVSLAEAKEQLRIEPDDHGEDLYIQGLIDAATARLDGWSGILRRCLLAQTWVLYLDSFPASSDRIEVPLKPLVSVTGVVYVDADGATQTLATSVYQVLNGPASAIALKYGESWPSARTAPRSIAVTFVAGEANRASVPAALRAAVLLIVGSLYENRESGGIPDSANHLMAPWYTGFTA